MGVNKLDTYVLSIIVILAAFSLLHAQEMKTGSLVGSASAQNNSEGTELTIYSQDIALVRETREFGFQEGINIVNITDIASGIDPSSVIFEDTESPGTYIIEQQFSSDNASTSRLLENHLGKEITVTDEAGNSYTGILLGHENDKVILNTSGNIITLMSVSKIDFQDTEDVLIGPALTWQIYSPEAGTRTILTSYLTEGINWKANYIVKLADNETQASIDGWATIDNRAGTSFTDARVKLVAGDVRRVSGQAYPEYATDEAAIDQAPGQFGQGSLFEYHTYTLNRTTTLRNGETKQISLLSEGSIPVEKEYIFDSNTGERIKVVMSTENTESSGLGMPLPAGIVSAYAEDSEGVLQFVGEDEIDHTPRGEEMRIFVGYAFDITGEKTQTDYQSLGESAERRSYSIDLTNQKAEDVNVTVTESIYGDWEITNSSQNYTKVDAFTAEFDVRVPANGEESVTYTVEVRYPRAIPY
jgi:hypothetical protein